MPPLVIAGLALAAASVAKGVSDKVKAGKIHPEYAEYKESPYAKAQLATAQQMMNGRMAGAATQERNIDTSQASYNNFIDRHANNGAQALAMAGIGQARADEAYSELSQRELQNKYGLTANLNQAYMAMTNEQDKVYQAKMQKYLMDTNQKRALNAAGDANIFNGVQSGISIAAMGGGKTISDPDAPQLSLKSSQAYKSLQSSSPSTILNTQYPAFGGPASLFTTAPAYSGFQLWHPPFKQA